MSPHHLPPTLEQGSVSSSPSLIKTDVCWRLLAPPEWPVHAKRRCCLSSGFERGVKGGHLMWAAGQGCLGVGVSLGRGLFRCGEQCCCRTASDWSPSAARCRAAQSESPVFWLFWRWMEELLMELVHGALSFLPLLHTEVGGFTSGTRPLPAAQKGRGHLMASKVP